jgi:hypothetical protein
VLLCRWFILYLVGREVERRRAERRTSGCYFSAFLQKLPGEVFIWCYLEFPDSLLLFGIGTYSSILFELYYVAA